MIKIVMVEDDDKEAEELRDCLERYMAEHNESFDIVRFADAHSFLEYKAPFDIVFMDIIMPNMTGMEAAAVLRRYNSAAVLIFVTTMVQFAVKSYEVDALDYVVKPVSYERVIRKLKKAIDVIRARAGKMLVVNNQDGIAHISTSQIYYIEVRGHRCIYHTDKGVLSENISLRELEKELAECHFMRCNSCYLVNPEYITAVNGMYVSLADGEELKISQPKRKVFVDELTNWMGQDK